LKESYKQRLEHVKDEKPKAEKELEEARKKLAELKEKNGEAKKDCRGRAGRGGSRT